MALTFCVANQKGGVGKTTTAVNLSAALSKLKQRVLLIDLDPQGNATTGSGVSKDSITETVYPLLFGQASFEKVVIHTEEAGYDILPANRELAGAEVELVQLEDRDERLKKILQEQDKNYDFVIIDCPPSLSMLTINALCTAKGVIVPMQCEYFAMEGLTDLIGSVRIIQAAKNPDLTLIGLLRVMFDPRVTLQQQVSEQLKEFFGDKVFKTVIPRNVRLAEAPSYGLPGVLYDKSSKGAKAYLEFGTEFLKRMRKYKKQSKEK